MDTMSRDEFIAANMGLARMVANSYRKLTYSSGSFGIEDLIGYGTIGLIKAYDSFEPEREVEFSTYAVPKIRGEIQRFLRDHLHLIRPPRGAEAHLGEILEENLERRGPAEIARKTGMSTERAAEALEFYGRRVVKCLDEPAYTDDGYTTSTLQDTVGAEDDGMAVIELKQTFRHLFKQADKRTQDIIRLRMNEYTQTEIAEAVGVSQTEVSRTLKKIKQQLRKGA